MNSDLKINENDFENFKWVSDYSPCFIIDSKNITIIKSPEEFYNSLKNIISKSKKRVILSSLYLGTGNLEKELVKCISETMNQDQNIKTKILLDYSRGLRGENNSKTMLQSLTEKFSDRFSLYLYHSPKLRGLLKKYIPERTNETIGIQHMKIYIADNNLIISGANLSNDYFVNRQDRYFLIENCENLCNFFESIFDSIASFSFKVTENDSIIYPNNNELHHPFNGQLKEFSDALSIKLNQVLDEYKKENLLNIDEQAESNLAYIYPLIQLNDCSIKIDELITDAILSNAPKSSCLYLAVGYFNLTDKYIDSIVRQSKADYNILLSSPEANGFYDAQGFSNNIPKIYSYLEEEFMKLYSSLNQQARIDLHEYKKDHWTFHAKGLWYYPKSSELKLPNATLIGSSNYGYRSVYRDVEANLLIHSKNIELQNKLEDERKNLFENTYKVTPELFTTNYRVLPIWLKLFTRAFRSFF